MLTILALYYSYSGDESLLLSHFPKAQALAEWLIARRTASLEYASDDPRYGIPAGIDEGDDFKVPPHTFLPMWAVPLVPTGVPCVCLGPISSPDTPKPLVLLGSCSLPCICGAWSRVVTNWQSLCTSRCHGPRHKALGSRTAPVPRLACIAQEDREHYRLPRSPLLPAPRRRRRYLHRLQLPDLCVR